MLLACNTGAEDRGSDASAATSGPSASGSESAPAPTGSPLPGSTQRTSQTDEWWDAWRDSAERFWLWNAKVANETGAELLMLPGLFSTSSAHPAYSSPTIPTGHSTSP